MFDLSFVAESYAKFFKNQTFFCQKWDKRCFFGPLSLNFLELDTLKLELLSLQNQKESYLHSHWF